MLDHKCIPQRGPQLFDPIPPPPYPPITISSTNLELRLGRAAVTVRTSLGRPLLELDVREARMGLCTQGPDVSRGFAFLTMSAWTHSPTLGVWEPLLEPWQVGFAWTGTGNGGMRCPTQPLYMIVGLHGCERCQHRIPTCNSHAPVPFLCSCWLTWM